MTGQTLHQCQQDPRDFFDRLDLLDLRDFFDRLDLVDFFVDFFRRL
jgi:hypothetical protein